MEDTRHKSIWTRLLWRISNNTGEVSRDPVLEKLFVQIFNDSLKPAVANGKSILNTKLDPVWLFPIGPLKITKGIFFPNTTSTKTKILDEIGCNLNFNILVFFFSGKIFKSDLTGCNLYLHNLKTAELSTIEVQRNANLSTIAVLVNLKIPILWMTGNYFLTNGKFLKIIPVKKVSGYFNVDLKRVTVGLIFSLNILEQDNVELDQFEMGIHWTASSIKYDTNSRHLDRITDFIINKVKIYMY